MAENKKMKTGLDLVRIVGMLTVVFVHTFLYNGYYDVGVGNLALTLIRNFCMICVPLFMVLSGYLLKEKTISKKYYSKIFIILVEYIVCSFCCYVFSVAWRKAPFSIKDFFVGIFIFNDAPYSWYVNMYIGLFLIAPFLNMAYNGLKTDKQKLIMVGTFVFLFSIVSFVNFLPKYWIGNAYPLMYYVIGLYLKDKQPKIDKLWLLAAILWLSVVQVMFQFIGEYKFITCGMPSHYSFTIVLMTICVFLLLYDINIKNIVVSNVLRRASSTSLSFFLISYIFDTLYYNLFGVIGAPIRSATLKQLYVTPLIIVSSFIVAWGVNVVSKYIVSLLQKTHKKCVSKRVKLS